MRRPGWLLTLGIVSLKTINEKLNNIICSPTSSWLLAPLEFSVIVKCPIFWAVY